ncbi:hypothetical protein JHK85_021556 [Glycine max]|nr:hypothetical protein JHK85_021556 [Glycine max]
MDGYIWIQRKTGHKVGVCGMNFFASWPTKEKSATLVSARVKADQRVQTTRYSDEGDVPLAV